jgi:hypothetical protein
MSSAARVSLAVACIVCMTFAASVPSAAQEKLRREMNVRQGPDKVFDRPVGEVLPALADAKPTGANGRVGSELVFWGYDLADGRNVAFFACALLPDVDCMTRTQLICRASSALLETRETTGKVVHRRCTPVATGVVGSGRPGCNDNENEGADLLVGLVHCG